MLSNLRVPTTKQIRSLEAAWIESIAEISDGLNWGQTLMEVAGRGAALAALSLWDENPGHIAIFCGCGNNGGDGLVVARYLNLWGVPASCFVVAPTEKGSDLENGKEANKETSKTNPRPSEKQDNQEPEVKMSTPEAEANRKILASLGVDLILLEDTDELVEVLGAITSNSTVLVDALFGTGLTRAVGGVAKHVIEAINSSTKPVLAIDLPSGINSDTGQIMGAAVRADKTVTFGFLKPGHLTHPGAEYAGSMHLVDIGLPDFSNLPASLSHVESTPKIFVTTCGAVQSVLPSRPTNSNKGTFGRVLTIGGSLGMGGAGALASSSALRVGAGLSYLATPRSLANHVAVEEIVVKPLPETTEQSISKEALKEVIEMLDQISSVVIGPGLSQNQDTVSFVLDLLDLINKPCVIDADGLNALSANINSLPKSARNFVITPHPKELSRLTGKTIEELLSDRVGSALAAAKEFDCIVVFKGAYTLVAHPDGEVYVNPTGNSGMSTAGSGDVLSGIIGGLMAQGLSPFDAACAGVYIHGRAGDLVAANFGQAGVVAGNIRSAIPLALINIASGEASSLEEQLTQSVLSS
ncbi:NAD(P)H-hydrate dehydratase [bacterium]|nr:NAD(P)H-hydrate dehydratase [bacterium]MBP9808840.1 NAD(P)H-hydrate dehydratase [bacterium]